MLKETPNANIKIVGHTDSDGDDTKNLELSQRRAISVKNALSNDFGISAERLQTDGAGKNMPLVPNTTAEQKSKNRRVEFIKL
ncbi:putative lipoprotein YiaD [bioreactor metagenome]|uniref:Putative lipoprotein YiaD n=1 Tax=bioreactor metagenome TaxID=1076179 RepID=A0A644ZRY9_9ZZZZ